MSILEQFKLDRKLDLVTGCKRGIGKAMAEAGADIIGVSASLKKDSEVEKSIYLAENFTPINAVSATASRFIHLSKK
jgi:NAD(P)-dependent dehydrogenase (short-subunit alcohol dehydrogenase family)